MDDIMAAFAAKLHLAKDFVTPEIYDMMVFSILSNENMRVFNEGMLLSIKDGLMAYEMNEIFKNNNTDTILDENEIESEVEFIRRNALMLKNRHERFFTTWEGEKFMNFENILNQLDGIDPAR